jgi:hypothetical protein
MAISADLLGALSANAYMLLVSAMFLARIFGWAAAARWLGLASALVVIPLLYLFIAGLRTDRSLIYFVWLGLMIAFAIFELVADGILRLDLRSKQSVLIPYVMFFFAATGGLIGLAGQAGKPWSAVTIADFLIMAVLAFVQRGVTGL